MKGLSRRFALGGRPNYDDVCKRRLQSEATIAAALSGRWLVSQGAWDILLGDPRSSPESES